MTVLDGAAEVEGDDGADEDGEVGAPSQEKTAGPTKDGKFPLQTHWMRPTRDGITLQRLVDVDADARVTSYNQDMRT